MGKKILVLGGTRFFGKKLVQLLIREGHDVTIATRGREVDSFGEQVTRKVIDREDVESLQTALEDTKWDLIYDNICYSPQAAQDACRIFENKVGKYVFTSTLSVYELGSKARNESDFNPFAYPIRYGDRDDFEYGEGKRLAEAVFFQEASFPVVAVRFPIVLGADDYTKRLLFHVEHVKNGEPIGLPNKKAAISFINSDEAASFLKWVGETEIEGPVNACSKGYFMIDDMLTIIEEEVGKKAIVQQKVEPEHQSPFGIQDSWYMDTQKAEKLGYSFQDLHDWFPQLVSHLAKN